MIMMMMVTMTNNDHGDGDDVDDDADDNDDDDHGWWWLCFAGQWWRGTFSRSFRLSAGVHQCLGSTCRTLLTMKPFTGQQSIRSSTSWSSPTSRPQASTIHRMTSRLRSTGAPTSMHRRISPKESGPRTKYRSTDWSGPRSSWTFPRKPRKTRMHKCWLKTWRAGKRNMTRSRMMPFCSCIPDGESSGPTGKSIWELTPKILLFCIFQVSSVSLACPSALRFVFFSRKRRTLPLPLLPHLPRSSSSFHSQKWSILNFPCSLTSNITSHSMENMAFHSLLGWKMIIPYQFSLPYLYTAPYKVGRTYFWNLGVKVLNTPQLLTLAALRKNAEQPHLLAFTRTPPRTFIQFPAVWHRPVCYWFTLCCILVQRHVHSSLSVSFIEALLICICICAPMRER